MQSFLPLPCTSVKWKLKFYGYIQLVQCVPKMTVLTMNREVPATRLTRITLLRLS